jgi:D-alanine-D-alanine ligase
MQAEWIVLYGGVSTEREISLVSGDAVYQALKPLRKATAVDVQSEELPEWLNPDRHLVFPVFHGSFGEDGKVQGLLERGGFEFVGSQSSSSSLCMHKQKTKDCVAAVLPQLVAESLCFNASAPIDVQVALQQLGPEIVLKPVDQGSSVGLKMVNGEAELSAALNSLAEGEWMLERRILGHDVTVGVLEGLAQGVVEILPAGGVYDYHHKYTAGKTIYRYPAELPQQVTESLRKAAEQIFALCGCRDFGRIDFMLQPDGTFYFLEVNTIPGLTPTSLLPKSASCMGLNFADLILRMINPAEQRFKARGGSL